MNQKEEIAMAQTRAMAQTTEQAVSTECFFEEKRNEYNEEK